MAAVLLFCDGDPTHSVRVTDSPREEGGTPPMLVFPRADDVRVTIDVALYGWLRTPGGHLICPACRKRRFEQGNGPR